MTPEQWWQTSVSRIEPDVIELRGRPIADLLGRMSFPEVIWLLVLGTTPTPEQLTLFEAAMVAGVDHGPQAPSVAIARMAITCGIGLNGAIASGANALGDVHGGAGEQSLHLLTEIASAAADGDVDAAADAVVARWRGTSKYLPGFGHRFHTRDPRRDPLLGLVGDAVDAGVVGGRILAAALAVENVLNRDGRVVPLNVDGATAVVFGELGFPAPLARGFFVLSRSVGLLAHAWEQSGQGQRNKGPLPPSMLPVYAGSSEERFE